MSLSMKMSADDNDWDKVDDDIPASSNEAKEVTSTTAPVTEEDVPTTESAPTTPNPTPSRPSARQIVSIGSETDKYAFTFHEETLAAILNQIPSDKKVCVVSVVGAFRTGKSFLLSWFLRFLNHHESLVGKTGGDDTTDDAKEDDTEKSKWYEHESSLGQQGFDWRGGAERNTTGIWIWSKPYILPRTNPKTGKEEDIAVLLVDTQGMFDHETTMGLTAAIFGLSTLLSSYQIYNVDKRIQEDNLQQLALFSEYGRMAIQSDEKSSDEVKKMEESKNVVSTIASSEAEADGEVGGEDENKGNTDKNNETEDNTEEEEGKTNITEDSKSSDEKDEQQQKPFQLIEFLVRDWQNFEDEDNMEACEREMEEYLENVLAERDASDLKDTREQITSCFEAIQCYLMPHPGKAVTKKKYAGEIDDIDSTFKEFIDKYCSKVFNHLIAKSIHGRELTALELGAYIQSYAKMFETGAQFPEAATMLEATSNANNTNALNMTIKKYKDEMESVAGTQQTNYMNPMLLGEFHRTVLTQSMRSFDEIACFGNKRAIEEARIKAIRSIEESFEVYTKLNESRNPLAGFET